MKTVELEAKFCVPDLDRVRRTLEQRGAVPTRERHLERNWRFELPDRSLSASGIVFRLRVDPQATLSVKRPRSVAMERDEFEVAVDDSEAALRLVEALGYELDAVYEKYREQYSLHDVAVMLDELPFGEFVELEGGSIAALERQAGALDLDWSRRVSRSYLTLFKGLRDDLQLPFRDATFSNFEQVPPVTAADMRLRDALVQSEHVE